MGYVDIAGFQQNYHNTIEYQFGVWDPKFALVGFKFVNTGDSRVSGADFSLACTTPESNKKFGVTILAGYTYIEPVSLTPDLVYIKTAPFPGGTGHDVSFRKSSIDSTTNTLKYRFKHLFKADAEVRIRKLSIGGSYRYYSKMQNIDKAFEDIEVLTAIFKQVATQFALIKITDYWRSHNGFHVVDLRAGYKLTEHHKVSVIANNILNTPYFLRPLKIEPPRTVTVQYVYTF